MQDDATLRQPSPAWGDVVMPGPAAERRARMSQLQGSADDQAGNGHPSSDTGGPASNPLLDVRGRPATPDEGSDPPYTTPLPQTDAVEGNWAPLLGPGSEAMADGSSPAPRGFTGGAMGRTVSGLSPSFAEAASGAPPDLDPRPQPTGGDSANAERASPQP
jgi:hypothetical protein